MGSFSHIGLDAVMHADMNPLWPLLQGNPWLGVISIDELHLLCLALGVLGAAVLGMRFRLLRRA